MDLPGLACSSDSLYLSLFLCACELDSVLFLHQDGSHIKGLIINFIHTNWPSLLKLPFLEEFITPIIKASKGKEEISFYSLPEFEEWKKEKDNWHTFKIKYYKGFYFYC